MLRVSGELFTRKADACTECLITLKQTRLENLSSCRRKLTLGTAAGLPKGETVDKMLERFTDDTGLTEG
jgi:hypothetical protein